jgi:predicted transposase/invertase (TIGR01784 family)
MGVIIIANTDKIKDEHDVGYKSLFSNKDNFLHFLKKYIGAQWVDDVSVDDLLLMDKSFILKDYKDKEADVIYRVKLKGREVIFYVLLELQSSVDYTMGFRLLLYMTELLRREFMNADKRKRETKSYRLPAVVPIVLYNGNDAWTAARSFKEYLDGYELFGGNVIDFEYLLLDLNRSDEEFILATNRLVDNIFALDQKDAAKDFVRVLNILLHRWRKMESQEQAEFKNWVQHILLRRIPDESDRVKILESIERGEEIVLQYGWDRAFEKERLEGERKGIQEGRIKGIQEGDKARQIKVAENLLKMNLTVEQVAQGTDLPEKEVKKIKARLKL